MEFCQWEKVRPAAAEIYQAMGSGRAPGNPQVAQVVEKLARQAEDFIRARAVYRVVSVQPGGHDRVILDANLPFRCNPHFFRGADWACVAVATIGPSLEREAGRLLARGDVLEGFVLDAVGTAALDEVVGLLRSKLAAEHAGLGFQLGYTLSPGCQAIPLEEQGVVFSLLDAEQIEVALNESFLMIPVKSSSAVIPLGKELSLRSSVTYACAICNMHNRCQFSRT